MSWATLTSPRCCCLTHALSCHPLALPGAQTAVITIGNRSEFNPSEIEYLSGNATRLQFGLANYASLLGSIVGSIRAMACNEPVRITPGTTVSTGVVLGGGGNATNSTGGGGSGAFYGAYYNVTGPLDIRVNAGTNGTNTSLTLCISYTNYNPSSAPGGNDGCATSVSDGGNTSLVITAHPNTVNNTVYIVCEGSGGNGTSVYLPFSLDGNPCGTVRVNLTTVTVTADGGAGSGAAANGTSPNPGYNSTYYNVTNVVSNTTTADHPRCFSCPEDQVMLASSGVNAGVCAARCLSPRQWAWPFGRRLCQDCDGSCYKCAPAGSARDCLTCNDGFLLLPAAIDPTLTADQRSAAVAATGGVPTGRCVPYDGCPAGAFITSVPGEPYAEMCAMPTPTRSSSLSGSLTPSGTVAPSSTPGASVTGTGSPAATGSPTGSVSASAAATATRTGSGSASAAATTSPSGSVSASTTGTPSGSASHSVTPTGSLPTDEMTGSNTPPVTPSPASSLSAASSASMTPTLTGTGSVSAAASATGSASAAATATGSSSAAATSSMTATLSGTGSVSAPPTGTPASTGSGTASVTGTPSAPETPSMTATSSVTGSASGTPSRTPSRSGTPSRTPSGTMTPSMTPTMTATSSGTPSLSGTPSTTGGAVVANCTDGGRCGGHGTCRLVGGAPTCVCDAGYTGATCGSCAAGAFAARVCAAVPGCTGPCRGVTLNTSNTCFAYLPGSTTCPTYTLECTATSGPYAYNVDAPLCRSCPGTVWAAGSFQADGVTTATVAGSTCSGHGTCGASSGLCSCAAGWSGPSCGTPSPVLPGDPCAGVTCSGHGVCSAAVTGSPVCACSLGYYGADCSSSIADNSTSSGARRLSGGSGSGEPPMSARYGWSAGVWSRCSALCGANGTMSRPVSCRAVVPVPPGDSGEFELDRSGAQEDHVCSHLAGLPRPADAVPCNRFACGNATGDDDTDAAATVPAVVLTLGYGRVFADDGPRLQPDSPARDAFLSTVGAEMRAFLQARLDAAVATAPAELRGVDPSSLLPQEALRVSITTGNQVVAVLASAANVLALLAAAPASGIRAVPLAATSPPAGSDGTGTSAVDLAVSLQAALADTTSSARASGTWLRRADTGASALAYAPLTAATEPGYDASLNADPLGIGVGAPGTTSGGGGGGGTNTGAIIGGVIGGVVGAALLVAAALFVARRRARRAATHKAVSGKQVAAVGGGRAGAADANYDDGTVQAYASNPMGVDPDSQADGDAPVGHGTLLSSAPPPRVLSHQDTASSAVLDYTSNPMPGAQHGAGGNVKHLPRAGSGRFAKGFNLGLLGSSTAADIHQTGGSGSAGGASRDELRGAGPAGTGSGGARNRKTFAPSMSAIGSTSSHNAATIAATGPVGVAGGKRATASEAAGASSSSKKAAGAAPPMLATAAPSLGHSGTVVEVGDGAAAAAAPSGSRPRRSREDGPERQGSATTIDVSGK